MNVDQARTHGQITRALAPRLYATNGHDLGTRPELIHPPAILCHPCQDAWGEWGGADISPTHLDGGGEKRRRELIAQHREDIALACHQAGHERTREAVPVSPGWPAPERPASLLGARAKQLLDEFEALLPDDGLTREQRIARAVEQERIANDHYKRTRQHLVPVSEEKEGVA